MTQLPPVTAQDSDAVLVERTVAGDQRAYGLLVLKYQRRIQRLIGRMVRDVDLVEDIAQETFVRAYRALHQFRGDAQFYTWLYRIAVNTAKKFLLELKQTPAAFDNFSGNDEIAAVVNAAIEALPVDLRQAVVLREIEGLTYEEIAAAMNCPVGTVRSRIFRAREAISVRVRPLLDKQTGKRW